MHDVVFPGLSATREWPEVAHFRGCVAAMRRHLGFQARHPILTTEERTLEDSETIRRIVTGCSLTAALEVVGERWSFLILRGAFNGLGHFEQFQSTLGIARNILANRLARLVAHGLMERLPCTDDKRKVEYRLTAKGEALLPALVALRQWGARWTACGPANTRLVDTRDGLPVQEVAILSADGRRLGREDLRWMVLEQDEAPAPEHASSSHAVAG
jgi:DNA-binding HxlR family transcriptional regulator